MIKSHRITRYLLLAIVVLIQLESHLLQPLIMSRSVEVHPLAIALAVLTGTILAGIPGALLAVPLVAFLNATIHALRATPVLPSGDAGFPVATIAQLLGSTDPSRIDAALSAQRVVLSQQREDLRGKLAALDRVSTALRGQTSMSTIDVTVAHPPEMTFASLRRTLPGYGDEGLLWQDLVPLATQSGAELAPDGTDVQHLPREPVAGSRPERVGHGRLLPDPRELGRFLGTVRADGPRGAVQSVSLRRRSPRCGESPLGR